MDTYRIPFNKPGVTGQELVNVADAIQLGHTSGNGSFTRRCHEYLQRYFGCFRALLTTSCTHALEMSALLLDIQPGDEFIVPSYTFVSTANAFVLRGARPRFIDIRPDTLNLDEGQLERHLTSRTRAIVAVHYAGVGCDMDTIVPFGQRHGVAVVEDNAHGMFASYKGKLLGTFGQLATQSFHETKNIHCGEGGALLVNDAALVDRGEIIREKGTDRHRFDRGEIDKYTWVDRGSSYSPSDLLAAFLLAQLEAHPEIQNNRRRIWQGYAEGLAGWAAASGVGLPAIPPHVCQNYHMFYLLMPSSQRRARFIQHLKAKGILAVFHYVPLHLSKMGADFGGRPGDCPVTENIASRLVRLPLYAGLSPGEHAEVIDAVCEFDGSDR